MTRLTPNYAIPYPDNGDPIYKGAEQMAALALKVDATMTSVSGVPGPAGPAGPQGATGPAGPAGPTGATGPQGKQGIQGPAGSAGPKGDTGPAGPKGTGFTLLGTIATASDTPSAPSPGDAYLTEDTGDVVVWNGTGWSNVGQIQGPPGDSGPAGPAGPKGDTGAQGATGPQGANGAPGPAGPQGPAGPTGATGPKGDTGATGPQGPAGPAGADTPVPEWNTTGITFKDNGTITLGTGGGFSYRWRIDRGLFQLFYSVRWGSGASSKGGSLRMMLPFTPTYGIETVGTGSYWSAGGNFSMDATPIVQLNSSEIRFLIHRSAVDAGQAQMRIWDGSNGSGTGVPANPGFTLDKAGSAMSGTIMFPV